MTKTRTVLLAGTILAGIAFAQATSTFASQLIVAQAPVQEDTKDKDKADRSRRPGEAPKQGQQPATQQKQGPQQRPAAQERQPQPPAAQGQPAQPQKPAAQDRQGPPQPPAAEERRGRPQQPAAQDRRGPQSPAPAAQDRSHEEPPPAAQGRPGQPQAPAAQGKPSQPQQPTAQERREPPQAPAAQGRPGQPPAPAAQGGGAQPSTAQTPPSQPNAPAAQGKPGQPQTPTAQERQPQAPAAAGRPGQPPAPAAQDRGAPQPPAAQTQPSQPQAPAAQGQPGTRPSPAAQGQPNQQQPTTAQKPGAVAPPQEQVRDAREFLRQGGQQTQRIDQLQQQRQEVREGNRVFIREPDRTIIREGDRIVIRHNEADRFTIGAQNVQVERRGRETFSIVERPGGVRIITVVDDEGRLIRRIRRDPNGREFIIIDNGGPRRGDAYVEYVELPPPVIRIPRERYIVEMERANEADIYAALTAPPVERIDRRYTLDQIRYTVQLRDRMPRVDIDTINFDSGSWQLAPDQMDRLAPIADAMKRAIERNPREVFLIEGHTDAVGSDVDNLSLSDRRAETVAVALTEQFGVPAENLTTQGYGEQYLKVQTQGPERQNRRVTVRRITPLLDQQAADATSGARR